MISSKITLVAALLCVLVIGYIAWQQNSAADKALLEASGAGDVNRVEEALRNGAHVDVRDFDQGATPLILAAGQHHLDVVKKLVQSGADPNKADGGGSALFYACLMHDEAIANYLSTVGAKLIGGKNSITKLKQDKNTLKACR